MHKNFYLLLASLRKFLETGINIPKVEQDLLSSAKTKKKIMKTKQAATELTPQGQFPRAKASDQNTNSLVFLQEEGLSQASYLRNQILPATSACSYSTSTRSKHSVRCHFINI